MDSSRFDQWTRSFSAARSRRSVLRTLTALGATVSAGRAIASTCARGGHRLRRFRLPVQ